MEGGCLRHPDASTLGNMIKDGDGTDGWQSLTNPTMSPTPPREKTGTHHTDKQWKVEGGDTPLKMLHFLDTLIYELYNPEHEESDAWAKRRETIDNNNWPQTLLVVNFH